MACPVLNANAEHLGFGAPCHLPLVQLVIHTGIHIVRDWTAAFTTKSFSSDGLFLSTFLFFGPRSTSTLSFFLPPSSLYSSSPCFLSLQITRIHLTMSNVEDLKTSIYIMPAAPKINPAPLGLSAFALTTCKQIPTVPSIPCCARIHSS